MKKRIHQFTRSRLLILALFMLPSAYAADFKAGQEAYDIKDYQTARREFGLLAEEGHAKAQDNLGRMYARGEGVAQDYKKAVKWLTLSAEQGDSGAQHNLANMYGSGSGVPKDYKKAVKWFTLSAEQGYRDSQHNLGVLYNRGLGVPKDIIKAAKWYILAAEQGYAEAQYNAGYFHRYGEGVPQDYKKAFRWYTLAAEQGFSRAQLALAGMYKTGEGVPKDYKQMIKWYTIGSEQGNSDVQFEFARSYYLGYDVPKDYKKAVKWLTLSAEQDNPSAIGLLDRLQNKSNDWSPEEDEALTVLVNLEKSMKINIAGQVGFSEGGNRNIYFQIEYDGFECVITKDSAGPSTDIWYFNKQAVKMSSWCKKYSISEEHYLSLTPQSKRGSQFVVSAFRKAASSVDITTDSLSFKMSAKGFTKVWDSISSEAL